MDDTSEVARALFRDHGAALYRFAAVLVHQHQDAEDVVQETFLKLLAHLDAERDLANARGWLFTVAAHAARDRQRRRRRWMPWRPVHDGRVPPPRLPD
jgi:RNA polymerase sigma-70 factor, ECF subfamily